MAPARQLVYELKITLRDIEPPIWRRVQVAGSTKLDQLHLMIQAAMGWYNCHLHMFGIDGERYGLPDPDFLDDDAIDERKFRLDEVAPRAGVSFQYVYDFGDNWEHDVLIEQIIPRQRGQQYPTCLAGERRCPPEDVGGVWGYQEFLEAIKDPKHEEHESYLEWVGGEFDPEAFDIDETNGVLPDYKQMDAGNW